MGVYIMKKIFPMMFAALCLAACDCPVCQSPALNTNVDVVYIYDGSTAGTYRLSDDIRLTSSYNWSVQNSNSNYFDLGTESGAGGVCLVRPKITEALKALLVDPAANFDIIDGEGYKIAVFTFVATESPGISKKVTVYYRPKITISFDPCTARGGGGTAPGFMAGDLYESVLLPSAIGLMTGPEAYSILVGWSESASDATLVPIPYTLKESHTLYAVWGLPAPVLTVTYHANYGGASPATKEEPYYSVATALAAANSFDVPSAKHNFHVWNTQTDGMGTDYGVSATLPTGGTLDLYAVWDGDGSVTAARKLIYNREGLEAMNSGRDKHYKLMRNIDLGGGTWTPIGPGNGPTVDGSTFTGSLDGNGRTISNLTVSTTAQNGGLFGFISGAGSGVKELKITVGATGIQAAYRAGAVVGRSGYGASISGCSVEGEGEIKSTGMSESVAGGVVGSAFGSTIEKCYTTVRVSATGGTGSSPAIYAGGIAGYSGDGSGATTIQNCYATGAISATDSKGGSKFVGGIVGRLANGSFVYNCYATGEVIASSVGTHYVGGIVGNINSGGTISNCGALSSNVSATGANLHRVLGSGSGTVNRTNNYGLTGMMGSSWTSDLTGVDGENCVANPAANWWEETANWSAGIWNFSNSSLPTLK